MLKKLLIVEDSYVITKIIQVYVSDLFEFICFNNPRQAISWLEEGNRPHLILSDVYMPKMTGIEFLTYVKERAELKSIPFIMLSNDNSTSLKIATLQKGARDFITKPFEPIVFKARLLKALQIN